MSPNKWFSRRDLRDRLTVPEGTPIKHIKVFITGHARSGTTYMVGLFHYAGCDIGYSKSYVRKIFHKDSAMKGGLEWFSYHRPPRSALRSVIPELIKEVMHPRHIGPTPPEALKLMAIRPDFVIVMKRPMVDVINSQTRCYLRSGKLKPEKEEEWRAATERKFEARNENLIKQLEEMNLPYVVLEFPRIVFDFDYLWETLEPYVCKYMNRDSLFNAWTKLTDEKFIRFNNDA